MEDLEKKKRKLKGPYQPGKAAADQEYFFEMTENGESRGKKNRSSFA